jgi:hypothetical protein
MVNTGLVTGIVSTTENCKSCGRVPTTFFRFRSNSGFLFVRRVQIFEGHLCKICARKIFRDMQSYNLTFGWWGFISIPGMIVFLIDNRETFRTGVASLKRPLPADPAKDRKLAGRPVFARPSVLLVLAILVTIVVGFVTDGFGINREEWEVGNCVDYEGTNVVVVPCDAPTAEGRVLGITENVFDCPPPAEFFVDLKTGVVACLG